MNTTDQLYHPGSVEEVSLSGCTGQILYEGGLKARLTFYKQNVFRLYIDKTREFIPHPVPREPEHDTLILDKDLAYYTETYGEVVPVCRETPGCFCIQTEAVLLEIQKEDGLMCLKTAEGKLLWQEAEPLAFSKSSATQTLKTFTDEYFYGGGHQNGRFSHKNKVIHIKNESNWVDGGVASPSPFYISSRGYGVMRHTWQDGTYRFKEKAELMHEEERLDAFYFAASDIPGILNEYTELTGRPAFLPKYAYYLGHANCFNRDTVDQEDGSTRLETLMTDATGMVDQYVANDMPIGWFLPNDGYGCGYGQTDSFEGDLQNLTEFVAYAKKNGIQTGLWTQSEILPKDVEHPKKGERDITKEVHEAGTVAVKTDAAWVGNGYSMALKAVRQSYEGIEQNSDYRAFVVSLNGWAGTQRYASIWTGDETGGLWEYIRFQIPTYLGSGLSGQPNVGSDIDGIYGGKEPDVNTRDFQWKAFTPIIIDMDGWGLSVKVPWEFGEPYTSINRMYLKLKSMLTPYTYSIAWESHNTGMPMVRPMLMEYPKDWYTYGTQTRYQFMWGSSFLVAPVYNKKEHDSGRRGDIYLPDEQQVWIDYFSGERYQGGAVYHNFSIPLWKTPVFVKSGAIIPMDPANNSVLELDGTQDRIFDIYPDGSSSFLLYDDDGWSKEFKEAKKYSLTKVTADMNGQMLKIEVAATKGEFRNMCKQRGTQFIINAAGCPSDICVSVGEGEIVLTESQSLSDCLKGENTYFFTEAYNWNQYATKGSEFETEELLSGPKLFIRLSSYDIKEAACRITMRLPDKQSVNVKQQALNVPANVRMDDNRTTDGCAAVAWDPVEGAAYYEVKRDNVLQTNIRDSWFEDIHVEATEVYTYQVRARTKELSSDFSEPVAVTTKEDHYKDVPAQITASFTGESHPYYLPECAVDHNDATFFTSFKKSCIGESVILDMEQVYDIESLHYMPKERKDKGTIHNMDIAGSIDGLIYKPLIDNCMLHYEPEEHGYLIEKIIPFPSVEKIRFLKLRINESVEDAVSAHALYPYKVPDTHGQPAGDYNHDGRIDDGDVTFLINYVGIRSTDNVWSHVSNADVNFNGVIDAYDMAFLTSQLDGGIQTKEEGVKGNITCIAGKNQVRAGEQVLLTLIGEGLCNVNAFSAELIIDSDAFVLADCESGACKISAALAKPSKAVSHMMNCSARREEKGTVRLFAAFANKGEKERLFGDCTLATIALKAIKDVEFEPALSHSLLVGSDFSYKEG